MATESDRPDRIEALIARLADKVDGVVDRVDKLAGKVDRLGEQMATGFERLRENQAEMRGEMKALTAWRQSMDQRFTAIMRPYEPPAPRRPAAE